MTNYFAHETAIVDAGCHIGNGTKIWHFSHIMPDCTIGENCNIGQNVVVSPGVIWEKMSKFKTMFRFIRALNVKMMFSSGHPWFLLMLSIPEVR